MALHDHADGVPDQNQIRPCPVHEKGETRVVGRNAGDRLTRVPHRAQCRDVHRGFRQVTLLQLLVHGRYASAEATGLKKCRPLRIRPISSSNRPKWASLWTGSITAAFTISSGAAA